MKRQVAKRGKPSWKSRLLELAQNMSQLMAAWEEPGLTERQTNRMRDAMLKSMEEAPLVAFRLVMNMVFVFDALVARNGAPPSVTKPVENMVEELWKLAQAIEIDVRREVRAMN